MARERGGVFERGTRPHFSRCRNLFSFLFPFFFFLYKSTRREKMRIECRKQTHRYFIPPPLHLSNWNPSSFFTCLCNLLERGERIVEKIVARINKKKYYFLFEEDPTKSTPLFPPPCDLHTVHFSSNTIRLF
jgi:hypothetical protein